ncbi:hypothetical protein ABEB36_004126 [Hypothenemus hampei]|uniref:Uncharacterized protein n=1 Tax=Hypothenemus hampei TaxID=57062 RepID=A0ABD1F292_HYPHA
MKYLKTTFIFITFFCGIINSLTVTEIFKPNAQAGDLVAIVRVPRNVDPESKKGVLKPPDESFVRKARDSKYYGTYKDDPRTDRALKVADDQSVLDQTKSETSLGKRCTTCENGGYNRGGYDRGRDKFYDIGDPYSTYMRARYDPYNRYNREQYYDRYDDDDRDGYRDRERNRYYERYDPRERYYDRGLGYDNRGYDYRERDYNPYSRDRYDPYDDYYNRGYDRGGYSSRASYGGRPDSYGGYARGYSYGDRDRYAGSGNGYSGYNSYGGGSRARYPAYDGYDSGYRYTSYLYDRPSSTTTDNPKNPNNEQGDTVSPPTGRS